ncbi:DNA methyltransferase [Herbaspirillum sp.]|uniref:DNA methyltransferase n=13 Tax=Bacteria TaxID=2 RepID=UPI00257E56AC|nr:DNA methyltransferase [Herbaspirillum sp.]|tara:strand:+ start:4220 stop:6451 length:2232 start_codon:yes stop_codon:yes gene_type:complete
MTSELSYEQFLASKQLAAIPCGFHVPVEEVSADLFDFQSVIVQWALRKGRAAIFADTGLGKTGMQLVWAQHVADHTDGDVLILAPLCVAHQTVNEGRKFNVSAHYCRDQAGVRPGVNITNYEMLSKFDLSKFAGIVLDESSILKNATGATRNSIIEAAASVPYRLSCTATPSPNDFMELGNQVEFLGLMKMQEMLAMFFTHDGGETSKWILKGHGKSRFWEWMASWAVCIKNPSDIGYDGARYVLPPLEITGHVVESAPVDDLFAKPATGLMERNQARKESIEERVAKIAEIVNASSEQWVIWCHRNEESEKLVSMIADAKDVKGADSVEQKEETIDAFTAGTLRVLVTKPSIAGFGMNWQHCNHTAFVGLSDSWEQYYQSIRRFYRFGQKRTVHVHIVSAESEGAVVENIKRKDAQNAEMADQMVSHMRQMMQKEIFGSAIEKADYQRDVFKGEGYELHKADCVDLASEIESDSIDYSIFSPPFASLYTYSNSDRDMGNCASHSEFYEHFQFLIQQLYRITKPGRLLSFHCMNLPTSKVNDGYIGIRDFRGELIRMFSDAGWIYHSEVCIWKDPVTAMQRTKALGLLHKTIRKDSAMSRQGIPDYLVTMRKPGDNPKPVSHTHEDFPVSKWQRYASPVWMDINPNRTLNHREAREEDDERHICPLQLDVIERAIDLWTAPDDLVFTPFLGIGSEIYTAVKMGRRGIGSELKESYWRQAIKNLAEAKQFNHDLFSLADDQEAA